MSEGIAKQPETAVLTEAPAASDLTSDILGSRTFALSPALRKLLIYLWQHRHESLSEYAVAVEALGRSTDFDPKFDASVRVQISRLRQQLEKYYEQEGRDCAERLSIPLGSHRLEIKVVKAGGELAVAGPSSGAGFFGEQRRWILTLGALCLVLSIACGILGALHFRAASAGARQRPVRQVTRFWKSFFANERPTRIVLPSPVFFAFDEPSLGATTIMLRDTEVNDFLDVDSSLAINQMRRLFGKPQFAGNYTVTSDTFASVQLARYLDSFGLETSLHSSVDAPLVGLDDNNTIAIGTFGTLSALKPYLNQMTIRLLPKDDEVEVLNPGPGEPKRLSRKFIAAGREICPGVIGLLPSRTGRTRLLVLAGQHTSALVSFLTSANGQDQLERMWEARNKPEYFEVAVQSEMNGAKLVRFWPVVLHPVVTNQKAQNGSDHS